MTLVRLRVIPNCKRLLIKERASAKTMKSKIVPSETKRLSRLLRSYAEKYETAS